ncbi:hypothetical protein ACFYO1_03445 [Nocardia sp. NPDC006044]|uniref:hypothetical protein n=1 Tax=Nocardia sp. NPDC006044 TaxID=3364306 RepID=UPI0036B22A9C
MKTLKIVAGIVPAIVAVAVTGTSVANAPVAAATGELPITSEVPTLDELNDQIDFLIELPGSDEAKAAQMEGGMRAVVVARTLYNLGWYRAPLGSNDITGPETHNGNVHTAKLISKSVGKPTLQATVVWKRIDGAWKLSNSSVCEGVRAVGLPMGCDF